METPTPVLSTCLICFETRALKIVGNCKHSFCTECLSTVLDSLESGSEVFTCPSCKVDCPLPWDGVNGMVDFTGDTVDAADTVREGVVAPAVNETEPKGQETIENATGDVICDICNHEQKKVPALNICSECDNLNICKDCSSAHGTNKATKGHILTPFVTKKQDEISMCKMHHKLLIRFCLTCKEPVCKLCVSLDHRDHDNERLEDTIRSNMDVLKVTLRQREVKLKEMQELQKELTLLKAMAPIVDQQGTLIKEIEDHAQNCIDQIVKWKEDLKKQVKMDFKIVRDIPEHLEKVRGAVQQLQPLINRATQSLSNSENNTAYLDKLKDIQQSFEATATTREDAIKGNIFREELLNLNSIDHTFAPTDAQTNCGQILKTPQQKGIFRPQEIFHHEMQVDSEDIFIPCVAVLGHKYYAVAHPVKPSKQAEAIDIYEFPGTLKKTLRDHVAPLYDMSATPDGKLAVLSDGTGDSTYSVKLFDPETGYISSTQDIDFTKPLSLGVTPKQEYVILGVTEEEQKVISVVDKDGHMEYKSVLDQDTLDINHCKRITCGGRFIFVNEYTSVAVYEIQDTGLQRITTCPPEGTVMGIVKDISATIWDTLVLTDTTSQEGEKTRNVYLTCLQDKENKLEWQELEYHIVHKNVNELGPDGQARVSTRDGHNVVMSHGHTFRVFKC